MKIILYIITILAITALMTAITLTVPSPDADKPPEPTFSYDAGTKVLDRRYTPPNTYEVLYRTTAGNGLTVDIWREVSREEYKEDENDIPKA